MSCTFSQDKNVYEETVATSHVWSSAFSPVDDPESVLPDVP